MPAINASAQGGTVWSIRNLLVAAVSLLALFGTGISGYVLRNASLERATASDAASVNETADMLLESAGQWARERGATNLALNAADPPTDAQKTTIANFRQPRPPAIRHAPVPSAHTPLCQSGSTHRRREACARATRGPSDARGCRVREAGRGARASGRIAVGPDHHRSYHRQPGYSCRR